MSFSEFILDEVCDIGSSKRIYAKEYCETGIPFYRSKEVIQKARNESITDELYISEEKYLELDHKFGSPKYGDILLASIGANLGISYFVNSNDNFYFKDGNVTWFRNFNEEVNSKFLYYWLNSRDGQNKLLNSAIGSAQKALTIDALKKLKFKAPLFEEQKAIAQTLSCLDAKIELNNSINKTLEEMAQAIFKSWFVDFEPFQDGEFEDSEIGRIPKGWKVGRADDFFDIAIGKTPPRKEPQWFSTNENDVKWISISDMGNCGLYIFNTSEYLTKDGIEKYNVKIVPANTVLLSFKLTVGRVAITSEEMTTNEAIAHFKSNRNNINEFLYFYLKNFNYDSLGNTSSIASAVNSKVIKAMTMLMPDDNALNSYSRIVNTLIAKIKQNQEEINTLTSIRDSLLPKLISGEIRIPTEEVQ